MRNLTLLPKNRPSRASWRALLPLLTLLVGICSAYPSLGQRFVASSLTVSTTTTKATANTIYTGTTSAADTTTLTYFDKADLGRGDKFDLVSGVIQISSTTDTINGGGLPVSASSINYRVYLIGSTPKPAYTNVPLTRTSASSTSNPVTYDNATSTSFPIDLLALPRTIGGGTYQVDVYFDFTYRLKTTNRLVTDPGNGATNPFSAVFQVISPPVTPNGSTTTWISNRSDAAGVDWLNPDNWSNGVPTRNSNAIIPDKTVDTSTPLLGDPNATYEVKTLTLQGLANSSRALIRIGQSVSGGTATGANLRVYGDLNAFAGGILAAVSGTNGSPNPLTNSTLVLARNDGGAQAIRGSKLSVVDIRIEGRGLKAVVATELAAPNTLSFLPDAAGPGAVLRTAGDNAARNANGIPDDNAPDSAFPLNTTQSASVNLKDSGFISGETNSSFVQGILIADRPLRAGVTQTFGNIGLDITPDRNVPSPNVVITRTVSDPLRGPVANTTGPSTQGAPQPVKRQYGVSGDVNNNTTSTIVFHYLNSTDELNGIPESQLTLFKTGNNSPPFTPIGRTSTVDLVNHTVTKEAYDGSLNTITLGDELNPLPVVLASFKATRSNANVLVTWTTATETNSKGFEVQVSTDGTAYRTLGFVSSNSPNSITSNSYKYVDTEAGKVGIRYYRLHQIDLDGKDSYSPVRAVNFDGTVSPTGLAAYPNPFADKLDFNFDATAVGNGVAHVQLLDMTGRIVREQNLTVQNASLTLDNLNDLRSGLYLARITLPDGSAKTLRVQKQ